MKLITTTVGLGVPVVLFILFRSGDAFSSSVASSSRTKTCLFQETISANTPTFPIAPPIQELDDAGNLIHHYSSISRSNNDRGARITTLSSLKLQEEKPDAIAATTTTTAATTTELVPTTWSQALQRFFLGDIGPPLVVLTISGFIFTRYQLLSTIPFSITELAMFTLSIITWWVQEYIFHRYLLHSPFNWIGKSIHGTHHDKDYFHISIDPPALLLGWIFAAHFIISILLPQRNLCLSATIGYSLAGLVYEWSHYIVHTKVKPRIISSSPTEEQQQKQQPQQSLLERMVIQPLMKGYAKMRDNHIRHHRIDSRYWYAFSVTEMDDIFGTNPNVRDVKRKVMKEERQKQQETEGFQ
jgi:hypothetical protein